MYCFSAYIPLAICIFIFALNPLFDVVVDNAHLGIIETFIACFNIFMLRGFLPDGVTPGKEGFSTISIVGWVDFLLFDLFFDYGVPHGHQDGRHGMPHRVHAFS